jgi:hypothetical protein
VTAAPLAAPAPKSVAARAVALDPRVRAGMRTAGMFLLCTAAIQIVVIVFGLTPAITLPVDIVIGIQLLLERPIWRPWALIRGWAGLPLAIMFVLSAGWSPAVALGVGVYLGDLVALALLLTGTPSARRLLLGRLAAILAAAVLLAGVVSSTMLSHAPAA